jgi:hypothetical protein
MFGYASLARDWLCRQEAGRADTGDTGVNRRVGRQITTFSETPSVGGGR